MVTFLDPIEDLEKDDNKLHKSRLQSAKSNIRHKWKSFAVDRKNISPKRAALMIDENGDWNLN